MMQLSEVIESVFWLLGHVLKESFTHNAADDHVVCDLAAVQCGFDFRQCELFDLLKVFSTIADGFDFQVHQDVFVCDFGWSFVHSVDPIGV